MAPFERELSERECDFCGALAAMHELVGTGVSVWVLGARASEATLAFSGRVERGVELGPRTDDPVGFVVAGVLVCLSERTLERAWRCEYAAGAERWLSVGLRYLGGMELQIDQLPCLESGDVVWPDEESDF